MELIVETGADRHMTLDMFAMQAFTGLSIFTILMLMALGSPLFSA